MPTATADFPLCPEHECRRLEHLAAAPCVACLAEEAVGRRPLAGWFAAQPDAIDPSDFIAWVAATGRAAVPRDAFEGWGEGDLWLAETLAKAPLDAVVDWIEDAGDFEPLRLWVDDLRPAPAGWAHAVTARQAQAFFATGLVVEASFDFCLGPGPTGADVARWLDGEVQAGRVPKPRALRVHSEHPTGAGTLLAIVAGLTAERGGDLRMEGRA